MEEKCCTILPRLGRLSLRMAGFRQPALPIRLRLLPVRMVSIKAILSVEILTPLQRPDGRETAVEDMATAGEGTSLFEDR